MTRRKTLEQEKDGRVDHRTQIKEWLDILQLDTRKIPVKKELNKKVKEFEGVKYIWNDTEVLEMKKKGNGKVEITIKEGRKIVNNKELKLTPEFQEISDAINKLANYIKKNDITIVRTIVTLQGNSEVQHTICVTGSLEKHSKFQYFSITLPVMMDTLFLKI